MQESLSNRIQNLPVSQTLAMAAKARELKEQGKEIISLSLGEPDFNTPDFIKEAAIQAIHDNYSSYSPVNGYLELREAISRKFFEVFQIDTVKFKSLCSDPKLIKSLGIEANSLEGYLYPETYLFSVDFIHKNTKESDIILTLVNEFKRKYKQAIEGNLETTLSMHQLVTMASIIQGECVYSSEMDTVSSVYYNRLKKGMLLQADPTILYIIPGPNKRLYNKDYSRYKENPYNTYSHKGLPPGPINSPGFYAIRAAAHPAKTDFLFFVAKGNNQHHFTKNERDHINAKNKYLKDVWDKP